MRLLLDTHLLVWLAADSPRLSRRARAAIGDPADQLLFSAVSIWEGAIKFAQNRPDFRTDPWLLREGLLANEFVELGFSSDHGLEVGRLPDIHKDPFDRALLAQARAEGIPFLTSDKKLAEYGHPVRIV